VPLRIKPLYADPALLLEEQSNGKQDKYIAIADLHIGFESALYLKGITINPELAFEEMLTQLVYLIKLNKVSGIILLGDLKNTIGFISKPEWDLIPRFFKSLSEYADVYMVPGNHDSNIRYLTPNSVNMISSSGMVLGDTLLIHGHTMPSSFGSSIKRVIMGHIHPTLLLPSSILNGQRVWIYLKIEKERILPGKGRIDVIVIPTFNKDYFIQSGRNRKKSISPLINRALKTNAIQQAMIVSLHGSIIGDKSLLQSVI
jgi:putative SbcD/Mre11-related phosphoesterase